MKTKVVYSQNEEETKVLAEALLVKYLDKKRNQSLVFGLTGNLGAGKTAFAKGIAKALGIKRIISPTFILVKRYNIKRRIKGVSRRYFFHIDLYRLQSDDQIDNLFLDEILQDKDNIVVIEWADKLKDLQKDIGVALEYEEETKRRITVNIYDDRR